MIPRDGRARAALAALALIATPSARARALIAPPSRPIHPRASTAARPIRALTLEEFRLLPDDRIAVRTSLGLRSARALDPRHVELAFGASVTEACEKADSYRIVSFEDPAFAYEKFVRPVRAAVRRIDEAGAPAGCPFPRFVRTLVTLTLPSPMRAGARYYAIAQGSGGMVVTGGHTAQGFDYPPGGGPHLDGRVDLAVLGLRRIEPVGPHLLMLEFGPDFSPPAARDPGHYRVTIRGRATRVLRLGRISRVDTYIPAGWPFKALPMHEVYIELTAPFHNGDSIAVTVDRQVTGAWSAAGMVFGETRTLSGSLKVNQVGYLPDSPIKAAYLGRWMGSFPEPPASAPPGGSALLFREAPRFSVCDARTGRRVFSGRSHLIHRSGVKDEGFYRVDHSGENVYLLDFSAFRRPGRYFLSVPQVGRSLPFEVGDRVYERAFVVQGSGLFAQRCGIALGPPFSVWRRIACHRKGIVPTTQDRFIPHDLADLPKKIDYSRPSDAGDAGPSRAVKPASPRIPILHAYGGHHDAGDYNPRSHIDIAQILMDAYEINPQHYRDGQLAIPERTDGIPDILDEAHWALRLWMGLQDADGGVFDGTESNGDPNFYETVELDPLGDYAYAKDGAGSFTFAGAMAQAARIWRSLGRRAAAADFLRRARRAYRWALAHPPADPDEGRPEGSAYASGESYAAAELMLTTREAGYGRDFAAACVWSRDRDADIEVYGRYDQSRAAWAYARCPAGLADPSLKSAARRALLRYVDRAIDASSRMAYAFLRHPQAPITWGTGAQLHWAIPAAWAYRLTGARKYLYWIVRSCDNTLGANPLGISYIVGLGTRTVRAPLHNSRYSHLGEVVDGMQVNGPFQSGDGYNVAATAYPPVRPDFACLYTFVDAHFAIGMDEGLSRSQAEALAIFGLLLPDARPTRHRHVHSVTLTARLLHRSLHRHQ